MNKISKTCKEAFKFTCAAFYAPLMPIVEAKPRRVVLYYHSVKPEYRAMFERQMAYLAANCTVAKVSEIKTADANGKDVVAAITFDDAFESVLENAVPILKSLRLPASIFVPTGNLGRSIGWSMPEQFDECDEKIMSAEQIVSLSDEGFEILSHTVFHPYLTSIDKRQLRTELRQSKKELETIIGRPVPAVSYPHGDFNCDVTEAARKAGYRFGFTIEPHLVDGCDDMQIGRFAVSPADNIFKFKLKLNGAYSITDYLRRR
jgi:peptidoglycan/xylan/chitin deacetylase (PgdA/CDA1 family)